jgi:DNA (cytosine-5)-methyltransferase 1
MTHPTTAAIQRGFKIQNASEERPRLRLLDLFCCAGGAALGYARAGFEVVGVDIVDRPNFPFKFKKADALELDLAYLASFDAIHASPPCQSYSDLAKRNGNGHEWPRLIEPVREMLIAVGRPYVIENVEGAPLIDPVVLCGTMFPGLRVIRHRLFEANFKITRPAHKKHPKVHTFDKRKSHFGKTNEWTDFVQVTGGGHCTLAAARDAMGIPWMTKGEINEAIPPAYTEHIGRDLRAHILRNAVIEEEQLDAAYGSCLSFSAAPACTAS